jgi:hypothetical protein
MSYTPPGDLMETGDSCPSWSFKEAPVGTIYTGTVVSTEWRHQTDYDDSTLPLWWNPGEKKPSTTKLDGAQPVWQYVVTLDTDERRDSEDDGRRKDYVQKGKNGTDLLKQAVRDAGLATLVPGATYRRAFVGTAPSSNPKYNDRKVYAWKVEAPTASLDAPGSAADPFISSAQQAPAAQPAAQPAAASQPAW